MRFLRMKHEADITPKKSVRKKAARFKRGEIRKQAKALKSSRLWTAGKQVTSE